LSRTLLNSLLNGGINKISAWQKMQTCSAEMNQNCGGVVSVELKISTELNKVCELQDWQRRNIFK
jgi:hypothetical protein